MVLADGLYRVSTPYLCAGFVMREGAVIACAPILRKRIDYWQTVAEYYTVPKRTYKWRDMTETTTASTLPKAGRASTKPKEPELLIQAPQAYVKFERTTQPVQYQSAKASVSIPIELSPNGTGSTFDADTDFWAKANTALNAAKLEVFNALGLDYAFDDDGNIQEKGAQVTASPTAAPTSANVIQGAFPGATEEKITPACPECGGAMWDNREGKKNPRAPDFKCKNRDACDGVIWPARKGG